jgi:hypothetical protein
MEDIDKLADDFIDALDNLIRANDDMHEEKKYSNYREVEKLRKEVYEPAREKYKELLMYLINSNKNSA